MSHWPVTKLRHGASSGNTLTPEYISWKNAKARCFNPNSPNYYRYGARGITMCNRWSESFANFLADMGARPLGSSLDRINNDGHYEPGNCRWATKTQQSLNNSRNHRLELNGERLTVTEWARKLGISTNTIWLRLRKGWPTEKVLAAALCRG